VIRDEKDDEQEGSCQGSRFLDRSEQGGERESWQDMPQVKELKELKLPVGNEKEKADMPVNSQGRTYLPFYWMVREKIPFRMTDKIYHGDTEKAFYEKV